MLRRAALVPLVVLAAGAASAGLLAPRATDFASKYDPFTLVLGSTRRLLYGSYRGTLHLMESRGQKLVEKESRDLWSPVVRMLAADLDGDGQDEVVGYTQNARLFVLRGTDLGDVWNTVEGRFQGITAITVGDVDEDGQPEIVLVADGLLRVFSAMQDVEEWRSSESYTDTDIALGDVDGDGREELVMNGGKVYDAVYRTLEWTYEPGFGVEIDLYDLDGDGRLEVVGRGADGLLRVFDVDERRLKWN